ncbi:MAG TPA: RNase adapter RapZ [Candidatus Angelobacter sp.]|nr:RNase adapter RapZ [Candidatus Angelobacter sp.]
MSGAGRSTAARALEDLGWFVVDNLPPGLLMPAIEEVRADAADARLAVVVDVRGGRIFDDLADSVQQVLANGIDLRVLFLEAGDNELVRRFESSRRPHPLQGPGGILEALARERALLGDLRARADIVIDTSSLNVHDLRRKVEAAFGGSDRVQLRATVMSFGFKYGLPLDADIVNDVRFLPNPYWQSELRDLTGLDPAVSDYVTEMPEAREFLDRMASMLDLVSDGYLREGKRYVTVAIGCTGGKHRSVAMAENLAARLVKVGVEVLVVHRDLGRE